VESQNLSIIKTLLNHPLIIVDIRIVADKPATSNQRLTGFGAGAMSHLLEIFGRAITIDVADLIWHWLKAVESPKDGGSGQSSQTQQLSKIVELMGDIKTVDTAAEQLRFYLFENPSCTHGRLAAAAIYLHNNQISAAVEELNSVYLHQPNNTMALYALGHCYERLGRPAEAVQFYQDCLKFKNYLQLPRQRLAAIYLKNGQTEKTLQEYELLKNEYPDDVSTLVTLGHLYIAVDRYVNAIETFNTAILIHPDNFHTESDQTDNLIADGRLREALLELDELPCELAERPDIIARRADIFGMLGEDSEAVSHYEQALAICPDFLEATIKLGAQYLRMHAEKLAAQQFNRAVEINDRIVDAYIGLAVAQKLAGETTAALSTLSLAAAVQANSLLLFAHTATLQVKAQFDQNLSDFDGNDMTLMLEAVISAHRRQIALNPQNPDLHYRLGILMMNTGGLNEALEAFRIALEINPSYTRAGSKLAICLFETGQKEAALAQLISHKLPDKKALELHYRVALLYCDRIKFACSLINLQQYMDDNFTSTDTTVNISIILQNLGLLDRAAIMWDNLSDSARQAIGTDRNTPEF
jgi:tetratricopeptide (TPR) repeat protein